MLDAVGYKPRANLLVQYHDHWRQRRYNLNATAARQISKAPLSKCSPPTGHLPVVGDPKVVHAPLPPKTKAFTQIGSGYGSQRVHQSCRRQDALYSSSARTSRYLLQRHSAHTHDFTVAVVYAHILALVLAFVFALFLA
ncbi:hypothetical protein AURDEDRAFT_170629 [Auricularia subglabra TFB-10046 SS5]|nr:hypothetical protein AURDEDRAFT_170629 [Auricularia subglabra TFB-10046 SS5]